MLPIHLKHKMLILLIFVIFGVPSALAADGAYIVFEDGKEANLRDGYKELMSAMRELKQSGKDQKVVEINLDGNSFFIDAAQITVLCKDPCRSFEVVRKK